MSSTTEGHGYDQFFGTTNNTHIVIAVREFQRMYAGLVTDNDITYSEMYVSILYFLSNITNTYMTVIQNRIIASYNEGIADPAEHIEPLADNYVFPYTSITRFLLELEALTFQYIVRNATLIFEAIQDSKQIDEQLAEMFKNISNTNTE